MPVKGSCLSRCGSWQKGWDIRWNSVCRNFFPGEELELKEIRLTLREAEDGGEAIKNQLMEVYNIPEGNINISIQG